MHTRMTLFKIASRLYKNPSPSQYQLFPYMPVSAPSHDEISKELSLRLVYPSDRIGDLAGKEGVIIRRIQQESGSKIKVHRERGNYRIISILAKEVYGGHFSPCSHVAVKLQRIYRVNKGNKSSKKMFSSQLLISASFIGCLIGERKSTIKAIRKSTKVKIRILSKRLPEGSLGGDKIVEITGGAAVSKCALKEIIQQLKDKLFTGEDA